MKLDYTQVKSALIPEGEYEVRIESVTENVDGKPYINFTYKVRTDVQQENQGTVISDRTYKVREPGPLDLQLGGYSYSHMMMICSAAQLPADADYADYKAVCNALVGKCMRVIIKHEDYNGKTYSRVKYYNMSTALAPAGVPTPAAAVAAAAKMEKVDDPDQLPF